MHRYTEPLSIGLLLVCALFFFVGGPEHPAARSIRSAWDFGHVVFFFAVTVVWIKWGWRAKSWSSTSQWGLVLTSVVVVGFAIEGAQVLLGRSGECSDLLRNIAGAVLGLAFLGPFGSRRAAWARPTVRTAAVVFLLWAASPLVVALADEFSASRAFPVLADFETPFQLSRWESDVELSVERETVREGTGAMRVPLSTALYSKASLEFFPGDWSGAASLAASIFNPDAAPLDIHLRVHDKWHDDHGQRYDERFNSVFTLSPGWNDLSIPVADIAAGPKSRTMDLTQIEGLSFFSVELPRSRTIIIDAVELR